MKLRLTTPKSNLIFKNTTFTFDIRTAKFYTLTLSLTINNIKTYSAKTLGIQFTTKEPFWYPKIKTNFANRSGKSIMLGWLVLYLFYMEQHI